MIPKLQVEHTARITITQYIERNKHLLNISAIEKEIGVANGTISKHINKTRTLPYEKQIALYNLISSNLSKILDKPVQTSTKQTQIDITRFKRIAPNTYQDKQGNIFKTTFKHGKFFRI